MGVSSITQIVTASGSGTADYTITNQPIQGWTLSAANSIGSLAAGSSQTHTLVLTLLPGAPDWCNLGVNFCADMTSPTACASIAAPSNSCITIHTGAMGLPTVVPASVTTFTQAITLPVPLLAPYGSVTTQNVVFQGNIELDQNIYTFDNNSQLSLCPAVHWVVASKAELRLIGTTVKAASTELWRGITLKSGSVLRTGTTTGTAMRITDALYAVEILHKSQAVIQNTTFDRNHVGIYTPPIATGNTSSILINQTTFDCTASLLASSWVSPAIDTWAYAGIQVHDLAFLNMGSTFNTPLLTSHFKNLTNGIVAERSNLQIQKIYFSNIQPSAFYEGTGAANGIGIYLDGMVNGMSGIHYLNQAGFSDASNAPISFNNCQTAIYSRGAHLSVRLNRMEGIRRWGVYCEQAKRCKIAIQVNAIELRNGTKAAAIVLNHNDDPLSSALVTGNTLRIAQPSTASGTPILQQAYGGIVVNEGGMGYGLTIAENNITLHRASFGIYMNGNKQAKVYNNTVNFQRPFLGLGLEFERVGIRADNCSTLSLKCNTITSTLNGNTILGQTWGIDIKKSQAFVECNSLFRTATGMRFDGNCNGSEVKANSFKRHDIGLHYLAGTVVGPQQDKGNLWYGNFTVSGALYVGVVNPTNRYIVIPSIGNNPSYTPPGNAVALGWFSQTGDIANTTNCTTANCPHPSPSLLPVLDVVDVAVVNNQIPANPSALPWNLRKGLYHKLHQYPLLQMNPVMGQFYAQQQNSPMATVIEVEDAAKEIGVVDIPTIALLDQYFDQTSNYVDSITYLDSLYNAQIINAVDWINQRDALLNQWMPHHQSLLALVHTLHQQRMARSQQTLSINTAIVASNSPEYNEQAINDLYLQTISIGQRHFSASQIQLLDQLAQSCPDVDGNAVYRARSIRALLELGVYTDNCPSWPQNRMNSSDSCHSDVFFPNPSLEGTIGGPQAPNLWSICESTPDILPLSWGDPAASDSLTYAAVFYSQPPYTDIESFGCLLEDTLIKGKTYKYMFDLATPYPPLPDYGSVAMWLGNSLCDREQLVYTFTTSTNSWQTHLVEFVPNNDYTHFLISSEVASAQPVNYAFIDNLRPVPCDTLAPPIDTSYLDPLLPEKELMRLDEIEVSDFVIYPNPNSTAALQVDWGLALPSGEIVVVDALGRAVASYAVAAGAAEQAIDIAALPSGFYTVLLRLEERIIARAKLIVARE